MSIEKNGPVTIITGQNNSHVPFSTSLLIEGSNTNTLIDCGGGHEAFEYIKKSKKLNKIFLTHYHLDHIWGAYLFKDAEILINPYDYKKLNDPYELARASGVAAFQNQDVDDWINKYLKSSKPIDHRKPHWQPVIGIADQCYSFEKEIDVQGVKMIMLHTPGHTEGFCCPYFPEYGILLVGDYDLTSFGPWYNNADSDIDQLIDSAKKTLETDAKFFITSHHKGTFSREEYKRELEKYINIVYTREEKTKNAIIEGILPKDIVYREIFYFVENHKKNRHLLDSEIIGIAKHIKRLIKQGFAFHDYYEEFLNYYHLDEPSIHFNSIPLIIS